MVAEVAQMLGRADFLRRQALVRHDVIALLKQRRTTIFIPAQAPAICVVPIRIWSFNRCAEIPP
jgi:hypothetical protein